MIPTVLSASATSSGDRHRGSSSGDTGGEPHPGPAWSGGKATPRGAPVLLGPASVFFWPASVLLLRASVFFWRVALASCALCR
eukprot:scaffold27260_cov67-Isochrysis_galbana.AAC.1